jgi:hypothetical protein
MLKLNKELFDEVNKTLERKLQWWKEKYPSLEFDTNGRAIVGQLPKIDVDVVSDDLCFNWSESYSRAFAKYLERNEYKIKDRNGRYRSHGYGLNSLYAFDPNDLVENAFHFEKTDGRKVNVKASRVLQAVHKIWIEEHHPEFQGIINEIKRLRGEGLTYSNSEDVVNLTKDKERLGKGNPSIKYEDILNSNAGTRNLYLSINPLDKLTSSGACGYNPTGFSSCWSTSVDKMYDDDDKHIGYGVREYGCYSSPEGQIALGSILNTGMIYVPNGKTLEVDGFSFLGYKERSHVWIDTNGLWIEKIYPCKDGRRKQNMREICSRIFSIINDNDVAEYQEFDIQDHEGLKHYCEVVEDTPNRLFLDRVAINRDDDYKLVYLTDDRVNYSYQNPDDLPEDESRNKCAICGRYHDSDDMRWVDEEDIYVCDDCFEDHFRYCYKCDTIHRIGDMTEVDDEYYCDRCLDKYFIQCEDCEEWIEKDDACCVIDLYGNGAYVCESCRDENYVYCNDCGEFVHKDNAEEGSDEQMYCTDCIGDHIDDEEDEELEIEIENEVV